MNVLVSERVLRSQPHLYSATGRVTIPAYLTLGYLDLQHTICLLTFDGKLRCAPLTKESPRVLDAGCGTGVWSIDFGISTDRLLPR